MCQRNMEMSGLIIVRFSAKTMHYEGLNTTFAIPDIFILP